MELRKTEIDLLGDDQLDVVAGGMMNLHRVTPYTGPGVPGNCTSDSPLGDAISAGGVVGFVGYLGLVAVFA